MSLLSSLLTARISRGSAADAVIVDTLGAVVADATDWGSPWDSVTALIGLFSFSSGLVSCQR